MRYRSFVAVDPSLELLRQVQGFLKRFSTVVRGVRWVDPGGIHLTLRFLGSVEEEVLKEVRRRLSLVCQRFSSFRLQTGGIGCFPHPTRPRIIWLGFEGDLVTLSSLRTEIVRTLADLEVKPEEDRSFKPHVTLGRCRDPRRVCGIDNILIQGREERFPSFLVKEVALYKSDLTPGGARYTKLADFSLGDLPKTGVAQDGKSKIGGNDGTTVESGKGT